MSTGSRFSALACFLYTRRCNFLGGLPVSIKASTRQQQDVTIVDLSGQIKLGEGSSVLRHTIKDLTGEGSKRKYC